MKILLFNLGPIEKRIHAYYLKGYTTLFEHDVVLWGPIPDPDFFYDGKEIPIIRLTEETSILDIFRKLPEGWIPDIVTCETSVLNYVPDIYLCPVKTILFTRDSWADTIFNRKLVELFDFIPYGVVDRSLYNNYNVKLLPLTGFAVSIPDKTDNLPDYKSRKIDAVAIANYEDGFYHERYKVFYKLAELNKGELNIKYELGVKRSDLHNHYQKSKIVIDWAHTLSNRSFEAAYNGCLLFSHEDNNLMKEFWVPFEEYVPYNEDNILDLINHYLTNVGEAEKIIKNASKKIKYLASTTYGEHTLENIRIAISKDIDVHRRIGRCKSLLTDDIIFRTATPFLYNYKYKTSFPQDWEKLYFERINKVLASPSDEKIQKAALIEAARYSFLLKKYELSLDYLEKLEKIFPEYAWTYYIYARIWYELNKITQAIESVQKAIDYANKFPGNIRNFILPVIEHGNPCDGRRVTNYFWQPIYGHNNDFQVTSLLHLSYELLGDLYNLKNDKKNVLKSYTLAISLIPVPRCISKAGTLLINTGDLQPLLKMTEEGIIDSPYDSVMYLFRSYVLLNSAKRREAITILRGHRLALRSFTVNRKITFVRQSIFFIIYLTYISKYFGSKLILKVIKFMEQRRNQ